MQAPNTQGIMGLMSQGRAPQQPQGAPQQAMPSPMKASPMAGLGSVEDRVAAYRGNPAPLQQRYQMSQDLLDLLALQKIKSEKDAAARQMQLAMGQQQAAQGMEPQTVAQQREKEVMDMTKNELAQQRGDTAGQQVQQQQDAMKRAMSGGIAAAPGAASAAQPKAMASGGIVAFDGGGSTDKLPEDAKAELQEAQRTGDRAAMMDTVRKLAAAGYDVATLIPRAFMGAAEDVANTRLGRALGVDFQFPESAFGGDRSSMTPMMDRVRRGQSLLPSGAPEKAAPAAPMPPVGAGAGRGMVNPPMAGAQPPAAPAAPTAPQAAPAAPVAGAPAMPSMPRPAAPAGGAAPEGLGWVDAELKKQAMRDPNAERESAEKHIRDAYALTPEQKAVYEQGIAQRQKMFDETYDPERQRNEGLKRFLIGAGGRRYGELGGGAAAGMDYDKEQRANKLKDFGEMQKAREGLVSLQREGIKPSIEGGIKSLEVGEAGKRTGLEGGYKRLEGTLDRDSRERIAKDTNAIQLQIKQAMQDQTLEIKRGTLMQNINQTEQRALSDLRKSPLAKNVSNLEQMKSFSPKAFTKEQQGELDTLYKQLDDAEEVIRAEMDVYRQQIGGMVGAPKAKSGYKVTEITPGKK